MPGSSVLNTALAKLIQHIQTHHCLIEHLFSLNWTQLLRPGAQTNISLNSEYQNILKKQVLILQMEKPCKFAWKSMH